MHEIDFIERLLTDLAPFVRDAAADPDHLEVSEKCDAADLVTQVDLEVQRRIERAIAQEFPGDALMAEEAGKDRPPTDPAARCWVLDPIDGTHNFARGLMPAYGVSLAFAMGGQAIVAGVALPGLGDLFLAERGGGATRNGRSIHVSEIDELTAARIEVDLVRPSTRRQRVTAAPELLAEAGQVRCHGCAVVGLCSVAGGYAEAFVHPGPQPWDFAAAMLFVQEAGGTITRFDGSPVSIFDDRPALLASNGRLHDTLLRRLQGE